jgi:hypothetical protein
MLPDRSDTREDVTVTDDLPATSGCALPGTIDAIPLGRASDEAGVDTSRSVR